MNKDWDNKNIEHKFGWHVIVFAIIVSFLVGLSISLYI